MITNEQIEKYFKQQCTPQEAQIISEYLHSQPDVAYNYFVSENSDDAIPSLSEKTTKKLWGKVYNNSHQSKLVKMWMGKAAVAASIIIIIFSIFFYKDGKPVKQSSTIVKQPEYVETRNNGGAIISFHLPDGSYVKLMPNSSLRYTKNFDDQKRDIILNGEARFFVKKDSNRAFTVYSNDIAVIALGTEFTVRSFNFENNIKINLYEGKIKVTSQHVKVEKYLLPGDVITYNKTKRKFLLIKNNTDKKPVYKKSEDEISVHHTIKSNNWYMFNNQPMEEVMRQLEILYRQKIYYNPEDLKGMTFIGKIDKTDSLQKVLQSITLLNHLNISKTKAGYRIYKNP